MLRFAGVLRFAGCASFCFVLPVCFVLLRFASFFFVFLLPPGFPGTTGCACFLRGWLLPSGGQHPLGKQVQSRSSWFAMFPVFSWFPGRTIFATFSFVFFCFVFASSLAGLLASLDGWVLCLYISISMGFACLLYIFRLLGRFSELLFPVSVPGESGLFSHFHTHTHSHSLTRTHSHTHTLSLSLSQGRRTNEPRNKRENKSCVRVPPSDCLNDVSFGMRVVPCVHAGP